MSILEVIIFSIPGFILITIIHELGHVLAGLMSGFEFVYIRISSFMFIKQNNKLAMKKIKTAGISGQAIMVPKKSFEESHFIFYHLGGALMNFATFAIFLVFYLFLPQSSIIRLILIEWGIMGLGIGIINLIPTIEKGIGNDGYIVLRLRKNKSTYYSFWLQLKVVTFLAEGKQYRDIPFNWFDDAKTLAVTDRSYYEVEYLRVKSLMDRHEFVQVKILAESLLASTDIISIYRNEILFDLLFIELIGECRENEIARLYNDDLRKFIKDYSSISGLRTLYAYEKLFVQDQDSAVRILNDYDKLCANYPYIGEIKGEQELIEVIDKISDTMNYNAG